MFCPMSVYFRKNMEVFYVIGLFYGCINTYSHYQETLKISSVQGDIFKCITLPNVWNMKFTMKEE